MLPHVYEKMMFLNFKPETYDLSVVKLTLNLRSESGIWGGNAQVWDGGPRGGREGHVVRLVVCDRRPRAARAHIQVHSDTISFKYIFFFTN